MVPTITFGWKISNQCCNYNETIQQQLFIYNCVLKMVFIIFMLRKGHGLNVGSLCTYAGQKEPAQKCHSAPDSCNIGETCVRLF